MKFYLYGYKMTAEGEKSVCRFVFDDFIQAVQAAKKISTSGVNVNVIHNGKLIVKM